VEKEKFISIIKEHQKLIYKICFSYCRDAENRKDLQQEILLQLWSSYPKFDGRVKISTWIYRIALNTAIYYYRKDSKQSHLNTGIDESIISNFSIESESDINEDIAFLFRFIEQLNELDKALILLYLDDNKYKEIADIIGISETNVATKISRIKKKLKKQFNQI
jgi:RNA polymerase sigma-70 factor (ECF subfamily)